jgi:hypothetical protein
MGITPLLVRIASQSKGIPGGMIDSDLAYHPIHIYQGRRVNLDGLYSINTIRETKPAQ